jgi:hypothetical protein
MADNLLTQNGKLKETSKQMGVRVFNFGIPAFEDPDTGKRTCPFAGECAKFCYAKKGAYVWSNVQPAFVRRYKATKQSDFVDVMVREISRRKVDFLRVHDSGDYYSPAYIDKWVTIATELPDVNFYSYTKSIPLWQGRKRPENLDIIYSEGSTVDHLIDYKRDRHARIFDSKAQLLDAGYVDASKNDLMATRWFNNSNKIGLIIH